MSNENLIILTELQVEQKLQRIARELLESNYENAEIVLIGIVKRGVKIATYLVNILTKISDKKITLLTLEFDKTNPKEELMVLSDKAVTLEGKSIVLVDDVLNSGKTLIHAVSFLVKANIKQLSTVVLVDRKHRLFPVRADFVGLTLSTTLKEHISVVETKVNKFEVYLK